MPCWSRTSTRTLKSRMASLTRVRVLVNSASSRKTGATIGMLTLGVLFVAGWWVDDFWANAVDVRRMLNNRARDVRAIGSSGVQNVPVLWFRTKNSENITLTVRHCQSKSRNVSVPSRVLCPGVGCGRIPPASLPLVTCVLRVENCHHFFGLSFGCLQFFNGHGISRQLTYPQCKTRAK